MTSSGWPNNRTPWQPAKQAMNWTPSDSEVLPETTVTVEIFNPGGSSATVCFVAIGDTAETTITIPAGSVRAISAEVKLIKATGTTGGLEYLVYY